MKLLNRETEQRATDLLRTIESAQANVTRRKMTNRQKKRLHIAASDVARADDKQALGEATQ